MAIADTLFLNGTYPVRIDQSINLNSQIATAIYTYSDGSKVYGGYAYNDATSVDYLAAAYGVTAVTIPTPAPGTAPPPATATPALSGFAVATNGLSITCNISGNVPLTVINGTYSINNIATPLVLIPAPNPLLVVDPVSGLTTIRVSFQTLPIYVGDVVKISTVSTTPATAVLSAVTVTNSSTAVPPTATPLAAPLSFASYKLGATSIGGKVTITGVDQSMAVSAGIAVTDFRELQFAYTQVLIDSFAIAFEDNSNFTRNIVPGVGGTNTPLDLQYFYNTVNIAGTTGKPTSIIAITDQTSMPFGSIVSVKKAPNGLDLIVSKSSDGVTFTPIITRSAALLGITTLYIKVVKVGNYGQLANTLTDVNLVLK